MAPAPTTEETLQASVIICTRNRGQSILCTLRSLLDNTLPRFEVIVLDQSSNEETAQAVAPFLHDARLRYLRLDTVGKGRALNQGVREARAEILLITDDDCEAPPNWLESMVGLFAERPQLAVAFCNVLAAPHDPQEGFIPNYTRVGDQLLTRVRDRCKARGIGAGMAARKSAILQLGGFDEQFGPGGPFPSYDEVDIAMRALLRGYQVYETDRVAVVHYGFRTMAQGRELVQRDGFAIGAGHAKLLKCGQWPVLRVCLYDFWLLILGPLLANLARLRKPPVLKRGVSFVKGFARGWRTPVDRERLLFK